MISVDTLISDELAKDNFRMAHLLALPGGLHFTDWTTDISFVGDMYVSSGHLLAVNAIKREGDIKTHEHTVKLSGVDQAVTDLFESNDFSGQPCSISRVFIDDAGAVIADEAMILYQGTLDGWSMSEGKSSAGLNLKLTNNWSANKQTSGRRTTMSSQKEVDATDIFFDSAHVEQSNIEWGI